MSTSEHPVILIVEDNDMTLTMLKTLFEVNNYEILTCTTGAECLDILKLTMPNIVLMDIMMPDLDGLTVIQRIKSAPEYEDLPVVFLTALNDTNIITQCFNAGATDFITKPFKNQEILVRIDAIIKQNSKNKLLKARKETLEKINTTIQHDIHSFESQNIELKRIDEAKNDFIASITHDLKTPLTTIRSISEMMRDSTVSESSRISYLNFIISQVDLLTEMIHNTLQALKRIPESTEIKKDRINIKEFFAELANKFEMIITSQHLDFVYQNDSSVTFIEFDSAKISELLDNLISNAIKYTETGYIAMHVFDETHKLYITIEDTGVGIPDDELENVFTKFYRVKETSSNVWGNGLGLYISKKIALAHGGNLQAYNRQGAGAMFRVYLPLEDE